MTYGGSGLRTTLLCGGFALASGPPDSLLSLLPPLLVLDAAGTSGSPWTRWLEPAFLLLRSEGARDAPGAAAIMAKIADVFLTEIVRRYLSGLDCPRHSGGRSAMLRARIAVSRRPRTACGQPPLTTGPGTGRGYVVT